jgi:cytochrome c oxidase subunit II
LTRCAEHANGDDVHAASIFDAVGAPADAIRTLSLLVLAITGVIFVIVGGLLVYCLVRYRRRPGDDGREPPQVYGSNPVELAWTVVPILIVFVLITTATRTTFEIQAAPPPADAIQVRVVGHQWWWEFQYPALGVITANELHIPVSDPAHPTPTYLTLESADVAHSFWIPQLAGKTDLIPNRRNVMWMAPAKAGTYLGQCAEFCGTQHARMLLRVVVHPADDFARWVQAQRQPAARNPREETGRQLFEATACVSCHTVRGTSASGTFGPDLTHLMSRETLGAGAAQNDLASLRAWVEDPNRLKPGALMPAMQLTQPQLDQVVSYLASLR